MLKVMVSAICVLGAAMPLASHASAAEIKASDIAGRWQGETYAQEKGGNLTLVIVACAATGAGTSRSDVSPPSWSGSAD
jgi:hypothetical protein